MSNDSTIELTIEFTDPDLISEILDQEVRWLEAQLEHLEGIECSRVLAPASPEETKGVGAIIMSILTTEISLACAQSCIENIFRLTQDKPIKIEVTFRGIKASWEAVGQKDSAFALQSILELTERLKSNDKIVELHS